MTAGLRALIYHGSALPRLRFVERSCSIVNDFQLLRPFEHIRLIHSRYSTLGKSALECQTERSADQPDTEERDSHFITRWTAGAMI